MVQENERKVYEQLYGVGGSSGNVNGNNNNGRTRRASKSKDPQEEIYSSEKKTPGNPAKKGTRKNSIKKREEYSSALEMDQWPVESAYAVYPDYEPKYVSAMNLRERPAMAMHMQYHQQQHVMPSYFDYYYYDRGYGPVPVEGHPAIFPGVSHHGKWASDHDISGTLKRMKKSEAKAAAAAANGEAVYGRRGEFRFNPAIFNGQMFRNANMRYSTESGTTSSGEDLEGGEEPENAEDQGTQEESPAVNGRRRAAKLIKSLSDDSVDQLNMSMDNSALVNFMRANNEVVNHEFAVGNERGPQGAVATRTTNIRYVTKVYVPRKLQQQQQQKHSDEEADEEQQLQRCGLMKKPSQIPQRLDTAPGELHFENALTKKSLSTDSFFNELDKIDIDEEQYQYEMQKMRIEEHLAQLKENTIKDYDSHDRKKLMRSNSHSTVMDGSGTVATAKSKSKLPVNRRLSLTTKPDLGLSRKMAEEMNNKLKVDAVLAKGEKEDQKVLGESKESSAKSATEPSSGVASTGNKKATNQ